MVKIGNFFFHYRNFLFPVFYIALFIPSPGIFDNYLIPVIIGLILALTGQGIRVITIGLAYIVRGGHKRQIHAKNLVTEGIFNHARNPLYIGNILEIAGLGVMSNSLFFVCVMIPFFLFIYQAIVRAEENFLLGKFGDEYRDYMSRVNRWIPKLSGLGKTMGSMTFNFKRVIIREYNATFIWASGAVLIIMKNLYAQEDKTCFNMSVKYFIGILIAFTVLYLIVRYLKKSKKITSD